jgi:hypothetical protein
VHDRARPLRRQRRQPGVCHGDDPVGREQRQGAAARALAKEHRHRWGRQREEFGETAGDLSGEPAFLRLPGQRHPRHIDERDDGQPEFGGDPDAAPGLAQRGGPERAVLALAVPILANHHAGRAADIGQRRDQARLRTIRAAGQRNQVAGGQAEHLPQPRPGRIACPLDRLPRISGGGFRTGPPAARRA